MGKTVAICDCLGGYGMDWGLAKEGRAGYPPQRAAPLGSAVEEVLRRRESAGHPAVSREGVQGQSPLDGMIADGDATGRAKKKPDFPGQAGYSQETNTPCREAYSVKFPGRSPGFWLLTNPLGLPGPANVGASGLFPQRGIERVLASHSGATTPDLHRLPFSAPDFIVVDNAGATWGLWAIRLLRAVGYAWDYITGLGMDVKG